MTPLLIVGDGPQEPTGLGRIHRDLAARIVASDLPVELVSVGGTTPPTWSAWRHFPLNPSNEDWGAAQVEAYYKDLFGDRPGVVWVIWDPGRLWAYVNLALPVETWAYMAIDAVNQNGTLAGPAAEAIRRVDRVLAYGSWAAQVAKTVVGRNVSYLPHGIVPEAYQQEVDLDFVSRTLGRYYKPGQLLVGCVATNQPRKDLGMFTQTLKALRARGYNVYGWLHTDTLIKAWSVQQLAEDADLLRRLTVTTDTFGDYDLAMLYAACDLTIAPGLGEGFGYPIVESLAAGTICLHGDYAGGVELLPKTEWRIPMRESRLEGVYALQRPVFRVEDWANAAERALEWRDAVGRDLAKAYCRGSVAHLAWDRLWPRWQGWIRQGIGGLGL